MVTDVKSQRPLSPHVGIYRWQITNTMSILHRISGIALSIGLVVFSAWLISAAWCPDIFAQMHDVLASTLGNIALFGWTVAFYYHLGNGMRHLNWDMGYGFKLTEVVRSGRIIVLFTIIMSLFTWAVALGKVSL